jgi:alanine racemase
MRVRRCRVKRANRVSERIVVTEAPQASDVPAAGEDDRPWRQADIDLDAVASNVRRLRQIAGTEHLIAVVKANGYGHGAFECARAALAGGADWLGVADVAEALALRGVGIEAPILAWLHDAQADFGAAVTGGISIGISSLRQLDAVADAARSTGRAASVQLKLDTGLSRNGVPRGDWVAVFEAAHAAELAGQLRVDGIFSHVSNASIEDDEAAARVFDGALELAHAAGLAPSLVHLAATAATLWAPSTRYNTVRVGIGIYGLSPFADRTSADIGLTPAMTLRTRVAGVRRVPAGTGVSYGYTYRTEHETTLALVPLGYGDGVPRQASNKGTVAINGGAFRVCGRIAMDQFVVDVGDHAVEVGDDVVLFGNAATGVPAADDWALAADTINYEIVTRIGNRVVRRYRGAQWT